MSKYNQKYGDFLFFSCGRGLGGFSLKDITGINGMGVFIETLAPILKKAPSWIAD